jgi:predicted RND superfamily exporter protein
MKKKTRQNKQSYFYIFLILFFLTVFMFFFSKLNFSSNNTLEISKDLNNQIKNTYSFYFKNNSNLKKK